VVGIVLERDGLGPCRVRAAVVLLAEYVRSGRLPDPEADLERPLAVTLGVLLALQLERAHQAGRAGELVEGQKPERVAHDHADTGARPGTLFRVTQAAKDHDERRQSEVGLGLAAARREEQQVDRLAVGIGGVGEPGKVHQDERELEGLPAWAVYLEPLAQRAGYRSVGDSERVEGIRISCQRLDAAFDASGREVGEGQELLRSLLAFGAQRHLSLAGRLDPLAVLTHEGRKSLAGTLAPVECAQRVHRELDACQRHCLRALHLRRRHPRCTDHTAVALHCIPLGGDPMSHCKLRRVRILQVANPLVPVVGEGAAQVRSRNEGRRRRDGDLRLKCVCHVGRPDVGRPSIHEEDGDRSGSWRDMVREGIARHRSRTGVQSEASRVGDIDLGLSVGHAKVHELLTGCALPDRDRVALVILDFGRGVVSPRDPDVQVCRRRRDEEAQTDRRREVRLLRSAPLLAALLG